MIVYGDPGYEADFSVLLTWLRKRIAAATAANNTLNDSLDTLRGLLIFAGQIEQAVWDDLPALVDADASAAFLALTKHVTSELAAAFSVAATDAELLSISDIWPRITQILTGVQAMLDNSLALSSPAALDVRLRVKLPEGYAFYALYPEQYAQAAQDWAAHVAPARQASIVVVGIRSIGTGLAALVSQTLDDSGKRTFSLTARPAGHPFARHIEGGLPDTEGAQYALVVDEGPGMSGSSMSAVAQALAHAGMDAERIAFLPGHSGDPGGQGSEDVKRWWAVTPRFVTPTQDMRWNGLTLPDMLAKRTCSLLISHYRLEDARVEDFGGGLWRRAVYTSEAYWLAACTAFEMPKYRVTLPDGTRVLWKFAGLATDADGVDQAQSMYRQLRLQNETGWTPRPLGTAMGFVGVQWINAPPLTCTDTTPDILRHIGRYIAAIAAPPLAHEEHAASLTRLADMLYWNTWESLGEEHAVQTRAWSERAQNTKWLPSAPTYGDGRMAPREWVRVAHNTLMKTDSGGHDADHTIVGKQCWLWDIAGAIVEWQLKETEADVLIDAALGGLKQVEQAMLPDFFTVDILTFYRMAYAAFRAGQTHLCAQMSGYDPAEQARLWQAYSRYKEQLRQLLAPVF